VPLNCQCLTRNVLSTYSSVIKPTFAFKSNFDYFTVQIMERNLRLAVENPDAYRSLAVNMGQASGDTVVKIS
jgi:hypothetical protein